MNKLRNILLTGLLLPLAALSGVNTGPMLHRHHRHRQRQRLSYRH